MATVSQSVVKRLLAVQLAAAIVITGAVSCATLKPGADAIAVRAEQTYQAASDTADFFFNFEDANQAALEAAMPGFHATTEKLRVQYQERMPQLLKAIDTYKATRDEGVLIVALALIQELINDLNQGIILTQRIK